jgi:hypothetical protein
VYATDALPPEEATTEVHSDEAVGAAASEAEGNQDPDEHRCEADDDQGLANPMSADQRVEALRNHNSGSPSRQCNEPTDLN